MDLLTRYHHRSMKHQSADDLGERLDTQNVIKGVGYAILRECIANNQYNLNFEDVEKVFVNLKPRLCQITCF